MQKQILSYKKIPLKDYSPFYTGIVRIIYKQLFEKFQKEFSLTSEEIDAFFSSLGETHESINVTPTRMFRKRN